MSKIIKWETLKWIHRMKYICIIMFCIIFLLGIIPVNVSESSSAQQFLLVYLSAAIALGVFAIIIVYPILNMISLIFSRKFYLEKIAKVSYGNIIGVRIFLNIVSFGVGYTIGHIGEKVMLRFATEYRSYFQMNLREPIIKFLIDTSIILPLILLSVVLIASTMPILKEHRYISIVILCYSFYQIAYLIGLLPNILSQILQVVLVCIAFLLNWWLYEKRLEVR